MQFTQSETINQWILKLDERIHSLIPGVQSVDRRGYRSTSYFLNKGMKNEICYILCYDQKANFGFTSGVQLQTDFPFLQGTGKNHRHLPVNEALFQKDIDSVIRKAFEIK